MVKIPKIRRTTEVAETAFTALPDYNDPILPNGLDHDELLARLGVSMSSGLLKSSVIAIAEAARVIALNRLDAFGEPTNGQALLRQARTIIGEHRPELGNLREALRISHGDRETAISSSLYTIGSFVLAQYQEHDGDAFRYVVPDDYNLALLVSTPA